MSAARVQAAVLLLALVGASAVTPVQKVIGLMNGMVEKGKKEKHEEAVQFASYQQFCKSTTAEKTKMIKEAGEEIESLSADIQKDESDAAQLEKDLTALDGLSSTLDGNLKAATKVRETEKADYATTYKDYSESIQALTDGIEVLKKENHATPQASAALLQVKVSTMVSKEAKRAIDDFLSQGRADLMQLEAPEAAAYEFQAQGIIDMLVGLKEKFEDERSDLEKSEQNAQNAFEMLGMDLKHQLDEAETDRAEKEETKAGKLASAATGKADLEATTGTKDDDTKYLSDLSATCEAKAAAFADRQKLRGEEIAAIEKAIEIMSSGAVAGSADKHLPALVQQQADSLAQLRASTASPGQIRVAAYLGDQALKLKSRVLSILSTHVQNDPLKKVKKMIKDLIVKLMEEANEEAEHKGWCDTEMSTNEQTRKEKSQAVEALTAEIDELQATIARLAEEVTELGKAVSELDQAVAKATTIRQAEKAKNEETIKDAQAAQEAVAQALTVLKDFYEKAAEATSLVQQQQAEQEPEVFGDEPYKGMGGAAGGVVGMVEVIQSDFARLESETTAAEEEGQKEYDDFMGDSSTDKAQKATDSEMKASKKQSLEQTMEEKQQDLDGTQKELGAAMEYFEKLKPSCMDAGESFEDRVARRKAEVESLQEALKILSGDDLA